MHKLTKHADMLTLKYQFFFKKCDQNYGIASNKYVCLDLKIDVGKIDTFLK